MEAQTKNCQNCKKDFVIESEDFNYYEKIKVPAPTWCPKCRMERRLSFINTWSIYWRNCDKCGEKSMSMYTPDQDVMVYCPTCWWSDDWDGTEYAMDYDPKVPFLEQVKELSKKTPYTALDTLYKSLKNSNYSNGMSWCKNCYMVFWADYCEEVYYSSLLNNLKYSSDCIRGVDSELCYESSGFYKCYQTFFSEMCRNSVDVWFSRNCYSCTNCIGCVNLRGASYQIFNIKYTKEEYQEKIKELKLDSWAGIQELKKKAYAFWRTKPMREYDGNSLNVNSTGEYIYECRNSKEIYIGEELENCKWCQFITVPTTKDCLDYSGWGDNASLIYEATMAGLNASLVKFSHQCLSDVFNIEYSIWCISGKNNFGCVNLKRKSFCILNKEYSKEEFEKLKDQIIEDMKKNPYIDKLGRKFFYGEFFPLEIGKFPYNKSNAMKFLPKTKEEAVAEGYSWVETEENIYKITKSAELLSDKITETEENILDEVVGCASCGRGYKIVRGELDLLRKMNLPLPHECPKCRESKRFARMTKPSMYNRTCQKCNKAIYTPYAPGRPEIVYCVQCYQQEFI